MNFKKNNQLNEFQTKKILIQYKCFYFVKNIPVGFLGVNLNFTEVIYNSQYLVHYKVAVVN